MSLLTKMRMIGLAGLAGLVLACGAGDGGNGPKPGCVKDSDCKGNRICLEGSCVASDEPEKDIYVPEKDTISEDNYQPNCNSHAEKVCSGDELLWYDSCGNPENQIEKCKYGCGNGMCNKPADDVVYDQTPSCDNECYDYGKIKCFGNGWKECGDYDADDCQEWGSLNSCGDNEKCQDGECISTGCSSSEYTCNDGSCIPQSYVCDGGEDCNGGEDENNCCLPNSYLDCFENNLWNFDSCDNPYEIATDCGDYGCKVVCGGNGCSAGCNTDTCWGLAQCFGECGDFNSQTCVDVCYPGTSDLSISLWEDLMLCILYDAHCLDSSDFQQCFTDAAQNECSDQWKNCSTN